MEQIVKKFGIWAFLLLAFATGCAAGWAGRETALDHRVIDRLDAQAKRLEALAITQSEQYHAIEGLLNRNAQLAADGLTQTVRALDASVDRNNQALASATKLVTALPAQLARIEENADQLLKVNQAPDMPNLTTAMWQGRRIKTAPFTFELDVDLQHFGITGLPTKWQPEPEGDPESTLPYPWPRAWAIDRGQAFSPETVFYNLVGITNHLRTGERPEIYQRYVDFLLARTKQYLVPTRDGDLVTYRFSFGFYDHELHDGWVSAHGAASVIAASVYYYRQTHDQRFLDLATGLVRGLRALDGVESKWTSYIDSSQFLWFEEYPLEGTKKAHVLNGHITMTFALVDYCQVTKDEEACLLARAGITTIKRYVKSYRRPGQANHYDLYGDSLDYGPSRTINQQNDLYSLTGDPFFKTMAASFLSDMPYEPPR
ncbi:D-glucuronyl C5-epimerase family protein [Bradyrhizobium sp. 6(2017)]|uniref:D-glucuronyl C5-epimerase family protein n=1 Tax=Bradyrhizobium sp. 6(2017) TaxID=1197460 RepID=UPI0013E1C4B6|nr:D-glucuronyl C5-epimerase family protein [Bradyrhizobium sp. 6(2017)]QIG91092.1 hypothetical protein G6P99_00185 [Bradyrhizobium sp. 6(2017)]